MTDITGNSNANTLTGTSGDDKISGLAGDDSLSGLAGNDTLIGGLGNDKLDGGDGSDVYQVGLGDGFDTFTDTGTTGIDTIQATAGNTAIGIKGTFKATNGIEVIDANGHANVTIVGSSANDTLDFSSVTLNGIAAIDGGAGSDTLKGSAAGDTLIGGAGSDTMNGGEGSDTYLIGTGAGTDIISDSGTTGTDSILAAADNVAIGLSSFSAASGIEIIDANGHSGVSITGGSGDNPLDFSATTLNGITEIDGLAGNDTITGSAAADTINGGAGTDTLKGGGGGDTYLVGLGDGVDAITDTGASGTDTILAAADNVAIGLSAVSGIEVIDAGGHSGVSIVGTAAANTFDFSTVTLNGITEIDGGAGNDTLTGSAAADMINGGAGNDTLKGGGGGDIYLIGVGDGTDAITDIGASGTDTILAAADNVAIGLSAVSGIEVIDAGGHSGVSIVGTAAANTFDFSTVTLNGITEIDGGAGNDTLIGSAAADMINGGAGNDTLKGGGGGDIYLIGVGDGTDAITDIGASGTDTILAAADNVAIGLSAVSGIEVIDAGGHSGISIVGTAAANTFDFSTVTLIGITAIDGGAGSDTLTGSAGADKLIGGAGNDTLKGGGGADLFVYAAGADKIQDFVHGADHIDVSATGVSDFATLQSLGQQIGANTVFTFSTGNTLTLVGAQFGKLTAEDFGLSPNTPPTFTSGATGSEAENSDPSHVVYQATVNDPDGAPAVFSLDSGGDNDLFSINASTGEVTFKNSPDFENPQDLGGDNTYNIVIHANDGTNDVTKAVAISVTDVNDNPPVTGSDLVLSNSADGTDFIIPEWALLANDSGKDANTVLQISGVSNAVGGTLGGFTPTSGTSDPVSYQATGSGAHTFHYAASDGVNATDGLVTVTLVAGATILGGDANEILIGVNAADTLQGGGGSNIIIGGDGNDGLSGDWGATASHSGDNTIDGGVGDDQIYGGLGSDTLTGGDGNDLIFGYSDYFGNNPGDGNDKIDGGAGDDVVLGGAGNDSLAGGSGNDTLHGDDGNDTLQGADGNDSLYGDAGSDSLDGGIGNNALNGGAGSDTITAGSGNDTISADDNDGDTGIDHVTAGGGDDVVTFYHYDVGDSADGGTGFDSLFLTLTAANDTFDVAAQTVFINFEQVAVAGGGGDDVLAGAGGNEKLYGDSGPGVDGNDTVNGLGGDDYITGGGGNNTLNGGDGNDFIEGDAYSQTPGIGNNTIDGGAGDDYIAGGNGSDTLTGGDGNDSIYGYSAFYFGDNGADGKDNIFGGKGDDYVTGGSGDDTLHGDDGNDNLQGDDGNDTIYADADDGDTGVDHVAAGGGDDVVTFYHYDVGDSADGGAGFDSLFLTLTGANDTFNVAAQTSFINFEDSTVAGGGGDDVLTGTDGHEKFYGDSGPGADGNDTINGLGGDDNIDGGGGNNILNGGDGNDFIEGDAFSQTPGVGNNTIDGGIGDDYIAGGNGSDTLTGGDGNDSIWGASAFYFGDNGADGKDNIDGGKGNDFVSGGSGDDTIAGGSGRDNLQGDDGNDTITADASSADTDPDYVLGGNGDDTVTFLHYDSGDTADGGAGTDILNLFFGSEDNHSADVIGSAFTTFEQFNLHGGDGNDTLASGGSIDQLFGDNGNDILTGGGGNDILTGGAGSDIFKYADIASGTDTITDFIHGADVIDVSAIDADTMKANDQDFAFVSAQNSGTVANSITWFQNSGTNTTVIQADNNGDATADLTIVLQGKVDLTAADLHL